MNLLQLHLFTASNAIDIIYLILNTSIQQILQIDLTNSMSILQKELLLLLLYLENFVK